MLYPLKLSPALKDYLWGGQRLKNEYFKTGTTDIVAESWEVSCHSDGLCHIENGLFAGKTLLEYIETNGKKVLGTKARDYDYFPLLIKLIDAKENLSVQVHPDDFYAQKYENGQNGKTEMWYILSAEPGAELIYGLKDGIDKNDLVRHVHDNDLLSICRHVPVHKGDVFYIPAGTLHAIGKGIMILEVQQSSNLTYRVYDYDRVDKYGNKRPLHLEKALAVINTHQQGLTEDVRHINFISDYKISILCQSPFFNVYHFALEGNCNLMADKKSFHTLTVLEREVCLYTPQESMHLHKGDSVFIPANMGDYHLNGTGDFLLTTL